jgi:hypothetical protein
LTFYKNTNLGFVYLLQDLKEPGCRTSWSWQDALILETKLGTMDWSMRVNTSILGMIIEDSWLAFDGCTRRVNDFSREK